MAGFAKNKVIKDTFYYIGQPSVPIVQVPDIPVSEVDCCSAFVLKVLADNTSEELNNDKSGFLWWFNDLITTAELTLQRFTNGAWVDVASMDANTDYGTPYDYEFYVNNQGESFIGYQLEWALVLAEEGIGQYRVKCTATDFSTVENLLYSPIYCLKTYTPELANGTIRVEYYLNGTLGVNEDDTKIRDYGTLNWYNSFRLGGFFGYPTSTYEEERVRYNNGARLFVTDDQEPDYTMKLKPIPFFIHEYMRTDVMMADDIYITDYNARNTNNYVQKNVYKNSGYQPQWKPLQSKLAAVEVKFKQKYNNHKKLMY